MAKFKLHLFQTKVLGNTIKKRIRQISVDDANSMSDLAQLIVNDLGSTSPSPGTCEQEEVDTLDLASTMPAGLLSSNMANNEDVDDMSRSTHF